MISYLIVAYRSREQIGDCIRSLLQQRGIDLYEMILIENDSAGSCADIVLTLCPKAVVIVNPKNEGYTRAMNQAISAASGDFLFFLNPDIVLDQDCAAALVASLAHDAHLAAVAPQLCSPDGRIQPSVRNLPKFSTLVYEHSRLSRVFPRSRTLRRWRNLFFDHATRSEVEQPMTSALLVRRHVMEKIGLLDERFFVFFSDVDLCRRLRDAGHRILFEPAAKAMHMGGGSTRQEGSWLVRDSHRGFYRYLAKHELVGWRSVLRPAAALLLSLSAIPRMIARRLSRRSTSAASS